MSKKSNLGMIPLSKGGLLLVAQPIAILRSIYQERNDRVWICDSRGLRGVCEPVPGSQYLVQARTYRMGIIAMKLSSMRIFPLEKREEIRDITHAIGLAEMYGRGHKRWLRIGPVSVGSGGLQISCDARIDPDLERYLSPDHCRQKVEDVVRAIRRFESRVR